MCWLWVTCQVDDSKAPRVDGDPFHPQAFTTTIGDDDWVRQVVRSRWKDNPIPNFRCQDKIYSVARGRSPGIYKTLGDVELDGWLLSFSEGRLAEGGKRHYLLVYHDCSMDLGCFPGKLESPW